MRKKDKDNQKIPMKLKNNQDLTFLHTDKTGRITIMNKTEYSYMMK